MFYYLHRFLEKLLWMMRHRFIVIQTFKIFSNLYLFYFAPQLEKPGKVIYLIIICILGYSLLNINMTYSNHHHSLFAYRYNAILPARPIRQVRPKIRRSGQFRWLWVSDCLSIFHFVFRRNIIFDIELICCCDYG